MKKLIEELEIAISETETDFDSSDYDCGMTDGFKIAIDIVKAHNPWIEVSELPPAKENDASASIDVYAKGEYGTRGEAFYDFSLCEWIWFYEFPPTHWAYLPEVKL